MHAELVLGQYARLLHGRAESAGTPGGLPLPSVGNGTSRPYLEKVPFFDIFNRVFLEQSPLTWHRDRFARHKVVDSRFATYRLQLVVDPNNWRTLTSPSFPNGRKNITRGIN